MLKALFVALFLILGELVGLACFASLYVPGYGPLLTVTRPITFSEFVVWAELAFATIVVPVAVANYGIRTFDAHFKRE
jgi:hypothetical protein